MCPLILPALVIPRTATRYDSCPLVPCALPSSGRKLYRICKSFSSMILHTEVSAGTIATIFPLFLFTEPFAWLVHSTVSPMANVLRSPMPAPLHEPVGSRVIPLSPSGDSPPWPGFLWRPEIHRALAVFGKLFHYCKAQV